MLMSCTEKHRKWKMHSVEHCLRVLCTEKPRKSPAHCRTQLEMHIVKHRMLMSCTEKHRKWEMHSVEHCI